MRKTFNFVSLQDSLLNQRTGVSFEEFQAGYRREAEGYSGCQM